jgi:hypothetical protein
MLFSAYEAAGAICASGIPCTLFPEGERLKQPGQNLLRERGSLSPIIPGLHKPSA